MRYNENFKKLPEDYIFSRLNEKVAVARKAGREVIDLGIGDVKLPLCPLAVSEMKKACEEMKRAETFKGYMQGAGLLPLREKISESYEKTGVKISSDEVFITDGLKSEIGNILELFGRGAKVLIPEPCYPAYAEANIIFGNEVEFLKTREEDGFIPYPPFDKSYDIIFLTSPNNPTGAVMSERDLALFIAYAKKRGAVIIFDGAYSVFTAEGYPKSAYEVSGAKECVIETRSFSKSYGFTGVRCGYTVVPKTLGNYNALYKRRIGARFNGVSYITQKGAESFFTKEGYEFAKKRAKYYKDGAEALKLALKNSGVPSLSGNSSPYVFSKCPKGYSSVSFCERLFDTLGIVATPGSAFGESGEGYFRLSAFSKREEILSASDTIGEKFCLYFN